MTGAGGRVREMGPVEESFAGRGRGLGLAQVATGLGVAVVALVAGGPSRTSVALALGALAYAALTYLVFARPAVLARTGGIHLRGEVRDVLVPWTAVHEVESSHSGLRVVAGDRVLRARGFAGMPPGAQTGMRGDGPSALDGPALYCQEVAAALSTAARRHQGDQLPSEPGLTGPVDVVRWDLAALPAVLLVAALALGLL